MVLFTNKWMLLMVNLFASLLFCFLFTEDTFITSYINVLFYMIAFYLSISLVMVVMKGRFFDGLVYSSRRFISRVGNNRDYMDEWENKSLPSEKVNNRITRIFFWQGLSLGMLMAVLLFMYYA